VTEIGLQRVEKLCRRFHASGPLPTKLGRALISTKSDGEPDKRVHHKRRARTTRTTILTPFEPYLRKRWDAGYQHVPTLWAELRAHGFTGSMRTVRGHVARWRAEPARRGPQPKHPLRKRAPTPAPPAIRMFSVRQATWLMLRQPTDLDTEEQAYLGELLRLCAPAVTACRLAQAFFALVRDRDAAALGGWLDEAARSDLPEMGGFAGGIQRDRAAVDAGLTLDWSQGQTEGFVNKLNNVQAVMATNVIRPQS